MKKNPAIEIDKKMINQSEFARQLNTQPSYISEVLSGKRTGPKAMELYNRIVLLHKTGVIARNTNV